MRVLLDVEAVLTTAADEVVGLVQWLLVQVTGTIPALRDHQHIVLHTQTHTHTHAHTHTQTHTTHTHTHTDIHIDVYKSLT